jgi:hypothetical protein
LKCSKMLVCLAFLACCFFLACVQCRVNLHSDQCSSTVSAISNEGGHADGPLSRLALLKDVILRTASPVVTDGGNLHLLWTVLFYLGLLLTLLMTIDCALNKRDLFWFFILWILGPLGGAVYLIYHQEQVTFPVQVVPPGFFKNLAATCARRCMRCQRSGVRLVSFEDGRQTHYMCELCRDELKLSRNI